eukprot:5315731-Prymnesium_polylepis.1
MCRTDREQGASVAEGAGARRTRRNIAAAAASRIPDYLFALELGGAGSGAVLALAALRPRGREPRP